MGSLLAMARCCCCCWTADIPGKLYFEFFLVVKALPGTACPLMASLVRVKQDCGVGAA